MNFTLLNIFSPYFLLRFVSLAFMHTTVCVASNYLNKTIIDYDTSFGKNDKHYAPFYNYLFKYINKKEQLPSSSFEPDFLSNLDSLCRTLYSKNYPFRQPQNITPRIPLLVHQIWLGSPFPEKYKKWQQTWQNLGPNWTYKLWTEKEVKELKLFNQAIYDQETNYGAKSDILRMEILYTYGGLYIDTDFECLNPEAFKILNYNLDFYTAFHPADCFVYLLANGLVAAAPKHPIVKGYIDDLPKHYTIDKSSKNIIATTGPGFFSETFLKHTKQNFKDIALPPSFVYPLGHLNPPGSLLTFESIKKAVVKPESLAIHWWESSWAQT
ncbi:hypothetical protein H0X48_01000 [Candidatus Dependentiae bacterium]|nr:hypothetical protein [Candidatus Dependentiae bacterium]